LTFWLSSEHLASQTVSTELQWLIPVMKLTGVFAALPTSFDYLGDVYQAKITQNVGRWNRADLAGYLVAGRTGEGALLNIEEKLMVWELTAQEAKTGAVLLAGISSQGVQETLELIKQAEKIGYHFAVVSPLSMENFTPDRISLYYRSVADQASLPIVIDNLSAGNPMHVPMTVMTALGEHPNIVAVVDGFTEGQSDLALLGALAKDFTVLVGDSPSPVPWLTAGSPGIISGFAAMAPFFFLNLAEAVKTREYNAAQDLERHAQKLVSLLLHHYGIPGLKYALDLNGYYGGLARLPLSPLTSKAKQEIETAIYGIRS